MYLQIASEYTKYRISASVRIHVTMDSYDCHYRRKEIVITGKDKAVNCNIIADCICSQNLRLILCLNYVVLMVNINCILSFSSQNRYIE